MISDSLQYVIGSVPSSAGSATHRVVEGRVHGVTTAGVTFTVPTWDDGKHVFGPAPLAAAAIPVGAHIHEAETSHTHLSTIGEIEFDTEVASTHTHGIDHRHPAALPRPGHRCLVLLLGTGVDRPWVVGWWPS